MLKTIKNWIFWYKRSRAWKHYIANELKIAQTKGQHEPPTKKELEQFKKEWDLGWDSHMITKVETRRTHFEQYITDPKGVHTQVWGK